MLPIVAFVLWLYVAHAAQAEAICDQIVWELKHNRSDAIRLYWEAFKNGR